MSRLPWSFICTCMLALAGAALHVHPCSCCITDRCHRRRTGGHRRVMTRTRPWRPRRQTRSRPLQSFFVTVLCRPEAYAAPACGPWSSVGAQAGMLPRARASVARLFFLGRAESTRAFRPRDVQRLPKYHRFRGLPFSAAHLKPGWGSMRNVWGSGMLQWTTAHARLLGSM